MEPLAPPIVAYLVAQGLLGIWAVVSVLIIRHLYSENQSLHNKRVEDALKIVPIAEKANENTDKLAEAMLERGRSEMANTAVITSMVQKFSDLERLVIDRTGRK